MDLDSTADQRDDRGTTVELKIKLLAAATTAVALCSPPVQAGDASTSAFKTSGRTVRVYTTADQSDKRFSLTDTLAFARGTQPAETQIAIFVDAGHRYQTLLGIGGAITDASAEVFAKLPLARQKEFLEAYYDPNKGIGYTWARTTIHSSDFSSASYTYVSEGDKALASFNIDHDRQFRIPLIKRAMATAGGKLTLFASPWSPPAFMKDNQSMLHGGSLLPEYFQSYATYYTKFIKAYELAGVPVWGISVQNEPMATQTWESSIYSAEAERDFLKNYLGPIMQEQGLGDRKIIVWDHNRDLITQRARTILDDPGAARYVWGIGFHWYETWTGGEPMYGNVAEVGRAYPDKKLLLTEASIEKFTPERYQYWPNGEKYGKSMINDFNSGAVAWTDWNILLDEHGGPNHVGNFCFAPIHADTATGALIYTPTYYYIGHFSKFIRPDARRVSSTSSRSTLLTTSFLNADNTMATVVMNPGDKDIDYLLFVGAAETSVRIPAHAIQTLVY